MQHTGHSLQRPTTRFIETRVKPLVPDIFCLVLALILFLFEPHAEKGGWGMLNAIVRTVLIAAAVIHITYWLLTK